MRQSGAPVPGALRAALADQLDLGIPLALDTRRIRAELGFREILPPQEALRRTVADELARGHPEGLDDAYRAEDRLLAAGQAGRGEVTWTASPA